MVLAGPQATLEQNHLGRTQGVSQCPSILGFQKQSTDFARHRPRLATPGHWQSALYTEPGPSSQVIFLLHLCGW